MNVKKNKNPIKATLGSSRIEKYYGKIVLIFSVLTITLILAILYFTFSKTTIIIYPSEKIQEFSFPTTISKMSGLILVTEVEGSKTSDKITSVVKKPAKAQGEVILINKTATAQPLVATTRLMSKEDILFRTMETVTVPARGEITAKVIADQEGEAGNIGPTSFEIVALWEGLKKDIYATSSAAMNGGMVEVGALTNEDIKKVQQLLEIQLIEQAYGRFKEELDNRAEMPEDAIIIGEAETNKAPFVILERMDLQTSAQVGEEVEKVEVTEKLAISGLVVEQEKIDFFIKENITTELKLGEDLVSLKASQVQLKDINEEKTDGNLLVTGNMIYIINEQNPILDVKNFTGKTEHEIENYLNGFEEVKSIKVQFSPFWLKRTPSLTDNIILKVNSAS